ncbi:hypothetical protein AAF712_010464 [Marasmius tenuissimus]|uniref:tRNA-5-taurinomethyluridine 2-sulfurtransferase n=1 Tax=Marasmius tenuissimus TaxID=585030 RepID=A0ABR2ZLT2_9AGAR
MSGGVDSSVTARLLADQDYDLSAVFMRNWDTRDESGTDHGCQWERDWQDVERVCRSLGIPCKMIDLSKEYWNRIFEPSLQVWESGETPNPDVWCNREIKFGALLERLPTSTTTSTTTKSWFATGHYARKAWSTPPQGEAPRPMLLSARDAIKDQSFYLSSITEPGLSRALFPIGDLLKTEVRDLARKFNLDTAERRKHGTMFPSYIPPNPGPIIDLTTNAQIGIHQGLWTYTIGQNARIKGLPERAFVAHKDGNTNTVFVVPGSDHPLLHIDTVVLRDWSWIWNDSPPPGIFMSEGFKASAKIRHRMATVPVIVKLNEDKHLTLSFADNATQKGVSPGQITAIWDRDGDWCLGCGTIGAAHSTALVQALDKFRQSSPSPPPPLRNQTHAH